MTNKTHTQAQKILIVEDDAIIARFIQIKLEELGYEVCGKARTGAEAITLANEQNPDLIMMDVMLEGDIDGIETVEEIRNQMDVPVVYLTASSDDKTIERLMKTEPHGFLIKPFDDKILESALHIAVYRHKAKKELSETKEMLRTTLESIDDMVFSLTPRGIFTHNHSGLRDKSAFLFFTDVTGKSLHEVFPTGVANTMMECIEKLHTEKQSQSFEFCLEEPHCKFWYNSRFTLRHGGKGNMEDITMVVSDVSKGKKMHQELVLSREKLSEAFSIAGLGSCDFLFYEQKHVCNNLFFDILGVTEEEEKRCYNHEILLNYIHPDDRNRFKYSLQQALDAGRKDYSVDFRIIDKKKDVKFIHALARIKYDAYESPDRMIMTFQDISRQKANEDLRHDVEMAMKTAEVKQKFFAKLSHEIRNPVSGISGLLHLLENTKVSPGQEELIQALKSSSESLLDLVNDVLDFSKIESGMMSVKTSEFALADMMKKLRSFYFANAGEKQIELLLQVDPQISGPVAGDENKILRILSNLVSNALKFTREGKVEVKVTLKEKMDSRLLMLFEVTDTGPGISDLDRKKLFREFSQLDNADNGQYKGSGLGLSICKELAELLGGSIGVISTLGQGSNFWFTIPLIALESQTKLPQDQTDNIPRKDLGLSVLLAEDIAVNRKVIQLMLEQMGCQVTLTCNGKEAYEKYCETSVNAFNIFGRVHFDIILLDQVMPQMDGITALKKMKASDGQLPPVIVLTADESFARDQKFAKEGFDDVLIKPVKPHQLYSMLRKWKEGLYMGKNAEKLSIDSLEEVDKKPVINAATLEMIMGYAGKDQTGLEQLFQSFFDDIDRIYRQTLSAIELNDYNALGIIVLSIKGLSGSIGASQLHAVARMMDRCLRNGEHERAIALIPVIAEKYSAFRARIETEYMILTSQNSI